MLAFIMVFLVISTIFFISMSLLNRNEFMQFFNSKKQKCIDIWSEYDSDERIIALAFLIGTPLLCVIYVVSDKDGGLQSVFEVMMQVIALTLAIVAAIIAYRNYRRKSGDKLWYMCNPDRNYLPSILLYNEKDKLVTIFAVDAVLANDQKIRLIDKYSPVDPFHLSAFESKTISLGKVFLYNQKSPEEFDFENIKRVECITLNGLVKTYQKEISTLEERYIQNNNVLRALRIKNKPKGYGRKEIDKKSKYWIHVQELLLHPDDNDYPVIHIFTGYISNDIFCITDESLSRIEKNHTSDLKNFLLREVHGQKVNEADYRDYDVRDYGDPSYWVNGLIEQEDYAVMYGPDTNRHPSIRLEKIKRVIVNNF